MYVPAHKAGGPIPGIVGVVESLRDHDVHVYTADRDLGETTPYPPPYRGTTRVGEAQVTYLPPIGRSSLRAWVAAWRQVRRSDLVHLNSLMSKGFTVVPLLLLWATRYRGQVLISPRGELAASALRLGGARQKRVWIRALRTVGLQRRLGRQRVVWVASGEGERADVQRAMPGARVIVVPEQLRPQGVAARSTSSLADGLHIVSVGRLAPVKGHDRLIRGLAAVERPVTAQLIGLAEDPGYVAELEALEAKLPAETVVSFAGSKPPDVVESALLGAHLFVLLTHGENFGHAIGEALRAGCPVLISDQTPWSAVAEAGAGVVLDRPACDDPETVARAIDGFASMTDEEWREWSRRAQEFVSDLPTSTTLLDALRESGR
jgi:glycosyltransferase involved in cell wall biosynthesis